MADPGEAIARACDSRQQAEEWALVLASAGILCRSETHGAAWAVVVAQADAAQAIAALDAYDRENRTRAAVVPLPVEYGPTYVGVVAAVLLAGFYFVTGPRDQGAVWFRVGSSSAARVMRGEVWRTVTALTLHADLPHVAGNAVFCALFGTALAGTVGPGVAMWLMLLSGAGGNALNAVLRGSPHSAVGASTAILGAVGSLGGVQFVRRARHGGPLWRVWAPMAAALGLLAMVGTGRDTDFIAHGCGFVVGAVLGAGWAYFRPPRLTRQLQWLLGVLALLAMAGCWVLAFASSG